jgi:hypothetical protein
MQKNKRGAIELSIGTIVIVVLAMSMLILGLVLIKSIFAGAKSAVDMSNDQITNEIQKIYGAEQKLGVYPSSKQVDVIQGKLGGFGVGIKNLRSGSSAGVVFSYNIEVSEAKDCDATPEEIMDLIAAGASMNDIELASGEAMSVPVKFDTQLGDPMCTVRFKISAKANNEPYGSPQIMDVTFKSA